MNGRNPIKSVYVNDLCHESIPCQHHVTIVYENGQEEKKGLMKSPDIEKQYGNYLLFGNSHGALWKKYPVDFAENIEACEQKKAPQTKKRVIGQPTV